MGTGIAYLGLPSSPGALPAALGPSWGACLNAQTPSPNCLGFRMAILGSSSWEPGLPVSVAQLVLSPQPQGRQLSLGCSAQKYGSPVEPILGVSLLLAHHFPARLSAGQSDGPIRLLNLGDQATGWVGSMGWELWEGRPPEWPWAELEESTVRTLPGGNLSGGIRSPVTCWSRRCAKASGGLVLP